MQLSPSTSSEPNLLALLFPTPAPTSATTTGGAPQTPAAGDFEQLFGTLTPAVNEPAQEAAPSVGGESFFATTTAILLPRTAPQTGGIEANPSSLLDASSVTAEGEAEIGLTPSEPRATQRPATKSARSNGKSASLETTEPAPAVATASALATAIPPLAPDLAPVSLPSLPVVGAPAREASESDIEDDTTQQEPSEEPRSPFLTQRSAITRAGFATRSAFDDVAADTDVAATARAESFLASHEGSEASVESPTAQNPAQVASSSSSLPQRVVTAALPSPATASAFAPAATPESDDSAALAFPSEELAQPAQSAQPAQLAPEFPRRAGEANGPHLAAAANFAVAHVAPKTGTPREAEVPKKSFLTASSERLAHRYKTLGTDVANSATAMSTRSSSAPLPHPAFEYADASAVPPSTHLANANSDFPPAIAALDAGSFASAPAASASATDSAAVSVPQEASAVPDAHRAVEVVLHAVDRVSERGQSAVNLEFSVGDADLTVRVELQKGEVHTTFRTDSADLRDALAQEWHAVVSASGDRGVRLAPAHFSNPDNRAADAFGGQGSSQQHGRSPAQREDHPAFASGFARAATAGTASASTSLGAPTAASPRALAPTGTAQRLHLFA